MGGGGGGGGSYCGSGPVVACLRASDSPLLVLWPRLLATLLLVTLSLTGISSTWQQRSILGKSVVSHRVRGHFPLLQPCQTLKEIARLVSAIFLAGISLFLSFSLSLFLSLALSLFRSPLPPSLCLVSSLSMIALQIPVSLYLFLFLFLSLSLSHLPLFSKVQLLQFYCLILLHTARCKPLSGWCKLVFCAFLSVPPGSAQGMYSTP